MQEESMLQIFKSSDRLLLEHQPLHQGPKVRKTFVNVDLHVRGVRQRYKKVTYRSLVYHVTIHAYLDQFQVPIKRPFPIRTTQWDFEFDTRAGTSIDKSTISIHSQQLNTTPKYFQRPEDYMEDLYHRKRIQRTPGKLYYDYLSVCLQELSSCLELFV